VEKIRDFLVGTTVLRGMSLVKAPPVVSILVVRRQAVMRRASFAGDETSLNDSTMHDSLVLVLLATEEALRS
jgi:hypothetical protein